MSQLATIIHKEFTGYFKNYSAYIFAIVYLLLSFGVTFYMAYYFEYDNSNLISFFVYQPEIFNILLPALTMKMWAEERRYGTIEFLMTQPINHTSLVLGKFFASFLMGCMLLSFMIPFIIYSSFYVKLDILNIIAAYLGTVLVIASLCALGCFISACNNNAVIAYLFTVFFGMIWEGFNYDFIISPLRAVSPLLVSKLSGFLNFYHNYQGFIEGQFDLAGIGYFVSFTFLMLWLNVIIIDYRKS